LPERGLQRQRILLKSLRVLDLFLKVERERGAKGRERLLGRG
jgi:hypothetical protein